MWRYLSLLVTVYFSLLASACQITSGHDGGNDSAQYEYDLTENGCATGEQKYNSKTAYCQGLTDNARNRGCALRARKQMHERDCGAWPKETAPENVDTENLDPEVATLLDKRLTGAAVRQDSQYFAAALTLQSSGLYLLQLTRGLSADLDPSKGTEIMSNWQADGKTIGLVGSGQALAGKYGGQSGVAANIQIPGGTEVLEFVLTSKSQ